ncbi:serpin family protein [bacterium]|nr:serpin family protein [bacterium]
MQRKTLYSLALSAILLINGCNTQNSTQPDANPPRELSSLEKSIVESANDFGFDIFKRLATARPDSNLFISPLSISTALGMTYNGAAGTTAEAIAAVLGYDGMSTSQINENYQSLIKLLLNMDENVIMEIANSLWGREGFSIEADFIEALQTYFNAEARTLNFADPGAVDIINGWIEEKTHGKIEDMLEEIDPSTVLFLINALYFKADWTIQFDPDKTFDDTFQLNDGSTVDCKMMNLHETFNWAMTDKVRIIDLPYGDEYFSMTIIQPNNGISMEEVLAGFNKAQWEQWLAALNETELDLAMPRFKVEDDWELKDVLTAMGMGVAFSGGADFSGINPNADLYIHRVKHRTFIEVNEEGTEAAAVTVVDIRETSVGPSMQLNRPFIYVIRDHHSNTMMFMGMMINPVEGM